MNPLQPPLPISGTGSSSHTAVLIGSDGSTNWTDLGPPVQRQGKFGGAITLDGTNDYAYTSGYKGITAPLEGLVLVV